MVGRGPSFLAVVALVGLPLFLAPAVARAEPVCPSVIGGPAELSGTPVGARLRWLDTILRRESANARLWTWTWVGLGVAGTTANVTIGALVDYDPRVDRFVAAGSTLGLALSTLILPLRVQRDDAPETEDDCTIVARREKLLVAAAEAEGRGRGVFAHGLGVAGGLAAGAILGFGYDHWSAAVINAVGSVIVNELKIWTRPRGAIDGLRRYRAGILPVDGFAFGLGFAPMVSSHTAGAALTLSY